MHPDVEAAMARTRLLRDSVRGMAVFLHPSGLWIEVSAVLLDGPLLDNLDTIAAIYVGIAGGVRRGWVGQHEAYLETLPDGRLVAELRRVEAREAALLAGAHVSSLPPSTVNNPPRT
jgi:hypothetical protein